MFTGIVQEMGVVAAVNGAEEQREFRIAAKAVLEGLEVGDSLSVNGVCLTATETRPGYVSVTAVSETLARSNLGVLKVGDRVDLERPVAVAGRFDGHIVQGHVDGVAVVAEIADEADSRRVRLSADPDLLRYIVVKGSVALDGVSLTVTAVDQNSFEVVLIPHTLDVTVLGGRQPGEAVNVEVDILAKYVERLLEASK